MILGLTKQLWIADSETGSECDLKQEGGARYWADPSTRVFMLAYKPFRDPLPPFLADFEARRDRLHPAFIKAIQAPPEECMLGAVNVEFDRNALAKLGYLTPMNKWLDIQILAYVLGFAGRLDDILRQTGINAQKHPQGSQCISVFSKQLTPWYEYPELWQAFRVYCGDDVNVSEQLLEFLLQWLDQDWMRPSIQNILRQELIYRRINARGVPMDRAAVVGAEQIVEVEKGGIMSRMVDHTRLKNPNSRNQLKKWLEDQGCEILDLQKATVRDEILYLQTHLRDPTIAEKEAESHKKVITALQMRLDLNKNSTAKFAAMNRTASDDDRLRNIWQFYGASRTGRVAGRVINPANLVRPRLKHPEHVIPYMRHGDHALFNVMHPENPVLTTLSWCIRASLLAPPDKRWTVADLTSIESVGLAWLAGCDKILDIFFAGRDTYKTFASEANGIAYDDVSKDQRTYAKPCVLGAGYGMSGGALVDYATGYGVELDEDEAYRQVALFRQTYHEIPHLWDQLITAAVNAVKHPGRMFHAYAVDSCTEWQDPCTGYTNREYTYKTWPRIDYWYDGSFLFCRLPSGRHLCYYKPYIGPKTITPRRGKTFTIDEALYYYGNNQKQSGGSKWQLISAPGSMLAENDTQAICRDAMWYGLEKAEADKGLEVIGDVYDEVMSLSNVWDTAALERLIGYMTARAPWMDDRFFLGADGYTDVRYRKD